MTKLFQFTDVDGILKEAEAFVASEFQSVGGTPFAPLVTNASGKIDSSFIDSAQAKAAALVVDRIASEDILRGDFLYASSAGYVGLASQNATGEEALVFGVARQDALSTETVEVLLMGVLSDPIYSVFGVNDTLFLDIDGAVTNVKPTTGYLTSVGRALGSNEILVFTQQPTVLG